MFRNTLRNFKNLGLGMGRSICYSKSKVLFDFHFLADRIYRRLSMTKYEFLEKMRHALANDLSAPIVQENVEYYDSYISEEMRKGRSETAVTEELGDPWAIARTIIGSAENGGGTQEYTYDSARQAYGREMQSGRQIHILGMGAWWKRLLLVLGIVGVIMLFAAVIGGIFSLLAPILVPCLIVVFISRMIGGNRRR